MWYSIRMLSKNKKRLKLKNPKCPQCGSLLKIHDYYGPKKAVRYACPNQNCELKTISENTLLKKQFYKCKYELIYNVLIRLIDEKKSLMESILSKGMIDQGIVEECIKELLRHSNKHCLDDAFTAIPMTFEDVTKIYKNYELPYPFIVLFPTRHKELYTCIVHKPSLPMTNNDHNSKYYDLLFGVQKDPLHKE